MSEISWAHLPNARLVDTIIADVTARPKIWGAAWRIADHTIGSIAVGAAWDAAHVMAWGAERGGAMDVASSIEAESKLKYAAADAALALLVWDSSADLLALTPDALRTIIDTCDGDVKHQAVLLLPAVIAWSTT